MSDLTGIWSCDEWVRAQANGVLERAAVLVPEAHLPRGLDLQ